jgi:hypothetical protein
MNLDLAAFSLGFNDRLNEKSASSSNFLDHAANENILPSFNNQTNWKYVKTPEGIRLSDGNHVFGFGLKDFGGEQSRVEKLNDVSILDFEKDKLHGGTAQIHRSSPHSVYMTLATGRDNPTFVLEHDEGKSWRYIPSKKMIKRLEALKALEAQNIPAVDEEAMLKGASEMINSYIRKGELTKLAWGDGLLGSPEQAGNMLYQGVNAVKGGLASMNTHPMITIGRTMLGGMLLNRLKRNYNPAYNQEMLQHPGKEINRTILLPALTGLALAGLGGLAK